MSEHRLSISGKNISIDEYVTPDFARKIIALLYSDSSVIVDIPQGAAQDHPKDKIEKTPIAKVLTTSDSKSDFTTFCEKHDVRRYCEVALAVGVYLASKGRESFDIKDYRKLFLEHKGSNPTNAPSNIEWALNNNWIAQIDTQNYKVTPSGRRVLNENFPDSVRGSTRGKPKKKV
ncbi:hypothetical protein [uncultured Shewanella sp.]|uniref:hypothetical protein n=1 Tax=uncultured Shewanella sp. TaxID=173975 RepID=UPI002635F21F|nr:hypothetical protein [uncultured Shewanella sp.]